MSKNVLIISSSLRKNGNSDLLAQEFAKGAEAAGNKVELIILAGKKLEFCRGCFACQSTQRCFMRDDADAIEQKMEQADVIVYATPIYYYEMAGQLKVMLDRGNPLFTSDYKFRDIYVLSTAAEDDEEASTNAVNGIGGWIACFPKARLAGTVFAGGVTNIGDIKGHAALQKAYAMGSKIK